MLLKDRIAVVTGGAAGIGAAISERLAAEGALVAVVDLDGAGARAQAERIEAAGGKAFSAEVDVARPASVRKMAAAVLKEAGRVDVLVNNAGISGITAPLVDYPDEEWSKVIEIDLLGVFYCTKAFLPGMQAAGWGRVVNIASVSGKEGNPWMTAYAAAKAGVLGFTKALGKEMATTGVLVNAVTPSGVSETGIYRNLSFNPELVSRIPGNPMGRMARREEVAAMVAWLASDECSFSTGAVFDISGGRATY
jgi:3-oxoacyl-[acyl-carrier protein] reductase